MGLEGKRECIKVVIMVDNMDILSIIYLVNSCGVVAVVPVLIHRISLIS